MISLLVAADEGNVIGRDNKLPWHLPDDLRYFKNLTWGMPILMGRKTFESIGKALPGRQNIVITRSIDWKAESTVVVYSLEGAVEKAKGFGAKEIFVIGGAGIFNSAFGSADRIYLTRVHHRFDGDVFFPALAEHDWLLVSNRFAQADAKNPYARSYQVWERVKN